MEVPDRLMKRLLKLLDANAVYLVEFQNECTDEHAIRQVGEHRQALEQVKHEIEESAKQV